MNKTHLAFRRILAFSIDYLVILSLIGALLFINLMVLDSDMEPPQSYLQKLKGHLLGFLTLTAPVWAYFTFTEASRMNATFGKRLLRMRVANRTADKPPSFRQIASRNIVKFLPWEIAHAAIWYVSERPFLDPMPSINLGFSILAISCSVSFVICLFLGNGDTAYDFISKTRTISTVDASTVSS